MNVCTICSSRNFINAIIKVFLSKSEIHLKINSWNSTGQKHLPLKRPDLQPINRVSEDLKQWKRKQERNGSFSQSETLTDKMRVEGQKDKRSV